MRTRAENRIRSHGDCESVSRGTMELSEKLKMLRKELHMSQPAVAKEMGLTMRGYQNIELGTEPRYGSLYRIAEYYDVSVDWLMGRTEDRYAHKGRK